MAAHFGTLAIYAQQTDIDGPNDFGDQGPGRAKDHGEVDLEIDVARARAALKRYGLDVDDRWFDVPRPDRRTQEKALDDLSRLGVSGMFARIASRFERTATELDRRGGGVAGMKLVQDDSWRTQFCEVLWVQVIAMSAESAAACAAMISHAPVRCAVCGRPDVWTWRCCRPTTRCASERTNRRRRRRVRSARRGAADRW